MAGMTGGEAPSGKAAMVARNQASRKRAGRAERLKNRRVIGLLARGAHVLGAPGRARAAHVMQFRPVGVERLGEEGAPEGAEFGKRLFCPGVAGGGTGGETEAIVAMTQDPLFSPRLLPPWARFAALKTSFGPIY